MASDTGAGMAAYAAPSLFQPHRARQAIRDAHEKKIPPLLAYYAGLSSIPITRFLAPMGYDAVWIDWEHTSCNVETLTTLIHDTVFMSQGKTIPFVRLPGHDHASMAYALDAGASIIVPQVETAEQARHIVSYAKFGSKQRGTRSVPPFRLVPFLTDTPLDPSKGDVWKNVNDQAAIMIQIESLAGINNLDAILTEVPDIDIVWLGSIDCRVSMDLPANWGVGDEPEWVAAKAKFFETINKHDKPYGGFAFGVQPFGTIDTIRQASERMSFLCVSADVVHLGNMAKDLQDARGVVGDFVKKAANGTSDN